MMAIKKISSGAISNAQCTMFLSGTLGELSNECSASVYLHRSWWTDFVDYDSSPLSSPDQRVHRAVSARALEPSRRRSTIELSCSYSFICTVLHAKRLPSSTLLLSPVNSCQMFDCLKALSKTNTFFNAKLCVHCSPSKLWYHRSCYEKWLFLPSDPKDTISLERRTKKVMHVCKTVSSTMRQCWEVQWISETSRTYYAVF